MVGGTGERPIVGAILGSVPHKLLHRSTVPVLVVPDARGLTQHPVEPAPSRRIVDPQYS